MDYSNKCKNEEDGSVVEVVTQSTVLDTISIVTEANIGVQCHEQVYLSGTKQRRCIWCSQVNHVERKTTLMCRQCGVGFCRDSSGRGCWSHHISAGGIPAPPAKGTHKRKSKEVTEEEASHFRV